jgi:hypothetical protein
MSEPLIGQFKNVENDCRHLAKKFSQIDSLSKDLDFDGWKIEYHKNHFLSL